MRSTTRSCLATSTHTMRRVDTVEAAPLRPSAVRGISSRFIHLADMPFGAAWTTPVTGIRSRRSVAGRALRELSVVSLAWWTSIPMHGDETLGALEIWARPHVLGEPIGRERCRLPAVARMPSGRMTNQHRFSWSPGAMRTRRRRVLHEHAPARFMHRLDSRTLEPSSRFETPRPARTIISMGGRTPAPGCSCHTTEPRRGFGQADASIACLSPVKVHEEVDVR
jgi:hypothetical protein